jgi:hypothetical protein
MHLSADPVQTLTIRLMMITPTIEGLVVRKELSISAAWGPKNMAIIRGVQECSIAA